MAESLKPIAATLAMQFCILLPMLAAASPVASQNLRDPTRPPVAFGRRHDGNLQQVPSGPVLQSVLVSPGRQVAIISGQTVKLGEKFGDARVVKITENEVVLSGSNGVQTLKLFPGIEKDMDSNRKHPQAAGRRQ
jgi:MSHA biogenesis protein MshK